MFYTAKKGNKKIIRPLIAVLAIAASFEVANAFTVDADMPAGNIIVEKIDGAACPPTGSGVANFLNGAFDGDVTGLPEGTIAGTAAKFFKKYDKGDYRPKAPGPLVNKCASYEGMAAVDLAGKKRKAGNHIDIGCYECQKVKGFFILVQ